MEEANSRRSSRVATPTGSNCFPDSILDIEEKVADITMTITMTMMTMMPMMRMMMTMMMMMMMMVIIMAYQRGWDTCVPTPKIAYFQFFLSCLFSK